MTEASHSFDLDTGNLLVTDAGDVDAARFAADRWAALHAIATEASQALATNLLGRENVSDDTMTFRKVVVLDAPVLQLPREKPVPEEKEPTRWEQFAKRKGIRSSKKRGGKVWDQETHAWVPRFGKGSAKQLRKEESGWIAEDRGDGRDPFERAAKKGEKKPRRGKKGKEAGPAVIGTAGWMKKKDADKLLRVAQRSGASMGVFDRRLKNETIKARKRKLKQADFSKGSDKAKNMRVFERLTK